MVQVECRNKTVVDGRVMLMRKCGKCCKRRLIVKVKIQGSNLAGSCVTKE